MRIADHLKKDLKILVVDDFVTMRRIVKNILQQLGFTNVEEAEDGQAALTKLKASRFGFVVSDWNMPDMMGGDLLRAVRADPNLQSIPFLMVTAEAQKENVIEAVQEVEGQGGASNYIVKPFNAEAFESRMTAIL